MPGMPAPKRGEETASSKQYTAALMIKKAPAAKWPAVQTFLYTLIVSGAPSTPDSIAMQPP